MYEDKTLVCKECGKEFVFTASVDSRMSRSAARHAATLARMLPAVPGSSSLLYVQLAAERPEFLSSRSLIARFTAASASRE